MRFIGSGWLLTTLGLSSVACAATFNMDPWIATLEPHKGGLSQILTLSYTEDKPIGGGEYATKPPTSRPVAVEISLLPREVDSNGTVFFPSGKTTNDFLVFPSQIVMFPGEIQKVQIQWVGNSIPIQEVAYGLIAAQLPVKLDINPDTLKTAVAMIEVLTRYEGVLMIRPGNVKPETVVDTCYFHDDSSGTQMVLWIKNKGSGMQRLNDITVSVTPYSKNNKLEFSSRVQFQPEISNKLTKQSLFPGQRRRLIFAWPKNVPVGRVAAGISFKQ